MTRDEIQRVIGYVRVSTDEQDDSGAGLEAQRQAIEAKASSKGWSFVGGLRKDVASGKSLNGRHQLTAALAELKAHKADALVVAKLDRLSRSVHDFASLLETARRQGWHVVMLDLELDTSTPMGEAMANMAMTFAQLERRMIGQRTRDAMTVLKKQGWPGGRPGRDRMIAPALEKRIRGYRAKGWSYQQIAAWLDEAGHGAPQGGAKWNWTTIRRVMERSKEA